MANERKTAWLNVYPERATAHPTEAFADYNRHPDRIGPAVRVDLIRTPGGWKQDDWRGRIEGLKDALACCAGDIDRSAINFHIRELEKEIADDKQ